MNRTSSVETVHILHFCQCSHQFYSLEHSTPFRSPLQCRPGCRRHLFEKRCMNQKGFWSSKFASLFSSLVLEFKAAYVRESICGCTLPGALSTVSIFASSELPACFWSFFVHLFCFMSFRMSGQLLSHPKDKLALKFLLPVLNVAELFLFVCFVFWISCTRWRQQRKEKCTLPYSKWQTNQ